LQELIKYAELGRLIAKAEMCDYEFNKNINQCNNPVIGKCSDFKLCQKRAELLADNKKRLTN